MRDNARDDARNGERDDERGDERDDEKDDEKDHKGTEYLYNTGALDNASGSAAVLEMARILSTASFPFTIVFILFTGISLYRFKLYSSTDLFSTIYLAFLFSFSTR